MSEIDDYRAQLQAKIDAMRDAEREKQLLHSDHSEKQGLPAPSPEFISQHIERPTGISEAEIKMLAYNQQQKEWAEKLREQENDLSHQQAWEAEREKTAQIEADQQARVEETARLQFQAAARDQAQREKEQAAANLAQTQEGEISRFRASFEQAAARSNSHEIDIE